MSISTSIDVNSSNAVIGVVGGGQLAKMLAEAASSKGVEVIVQTSSIEDPASNKAHSTVLSDPKDPRGTADLFKVCPSITFENEWINLSELRLIEKEGALFTPSISSLTPLVDKISQRRLLDKLGLPGPEWIPLTLIGKNPPKLPIGWKFPLMAKSSRGGYDGKGTKVIKNIDDLKELLKNFDPDNWFLEKWISYDNEFAMVASRDWEGKIRTFPIVETNQVDQICNWVIAPAQISHALENWANNIICTLLTELNYIGVIAIEFFYGSEGLLVNEIAPRTHNSGHYSIEACNSSQFDQQVCISAQLDVPNPSMKVPGAVMVNLLGLPDQGFLSLEERMNRINQLEGAHLHWYGKEAELPGRKLGHVTFLLYSTDPKEMRREAEKILNTIRSIWPIHSPK